MKVRDLWYCMFLVEGGKKVRMLKGKRVFPHSSSPIIHKGDVGEVVMRYNWRVYVIAINGYSIMFDRKEFEPLEEE